MKNPLYGKSILVPLVIAAVTAILQNPINAGSISGTVTSESAGIPVTQMDLNIYDSQWNYVSIDTNTDVIGEYVFMNVPEGDYYVKANPKYPHHYRPEYYDNSFDRDGAVTVHVGPDENVTGIDFQLADGYYFGGKILDSEGRAVPDIDLNVYDHHWNKMDVDSESDEFGRYFIGALPKGSYYIKANPLYAQPYVDQYWDHSNGPINAVTASITPPNDTTGINFDLISGTYIEGYVTDKDTGDPLPGIPMEAYNEDGQKMRIDTVTNSEGRYILGAYRSGRYMVRANPAYPDGYMDMYYNEAYRESDATLVEISSPKPTSGIDFQLPAGSYIRGNVTTESGAAIDDIKMKFYDEDWFLYDLAVSSTKSDGSYLSGALKPGNYYVKAVPIYPQPYVDEFYDDVVEQENAESVPVTLTGETTGINFKLTEGGYILGTVRDAAVSNPIYDMDLDLYDINWGWVDYSDHTDSDGEFLIGALPFGGYYVRCDPTASQGYKPLYYMQAFWPQDAIPVSISSDSGNAVDIDFDLSPGGKITGRITDAVQGIPVEDIAVEVYTDSWELLPVRIVDSGNDGTYVSHGIPTGNYYLQAVPPAGSQYHAQYYFESETRQDAIPVSVTESSTTSGINFNLPSSPAPTPTPPVTLGVRFDMPSDMFHQGDPFYLNAMVGNPGADMGDLPLFVVLDVYGEFFFWPSWKRYAPPEHTELDYSYIELNTGMQIIAILPMFDWPDTGSDTVTGLKFYGAVLTGDFSTVVGDLALAEFGYGP